MNPVFVVLVCLAAVLLWLFLVALYKPLGTILSRLWKNAIKTMTEESEEKENE